MATVSKKISDGARRLGVGLVAGLWLFIAVRQAPAQSCRAPSFAAPRSLIAATPLDGRPIGFAAVAKGDFNGDDLEDVVAVGSWQEDEKIYVFLNRGRGNFSGPTAYVVAQPDVTSIFTSNFSIAVNDFNKDEKLDLAVTVHAQYICGPPCFFVPDTRVAILLGDGKGKFGAPTFFDAEAGPAGIAAGDLNGDGKVDLAVANSSANSVSVLFGKGNGAFAPAINYTVGPNPTSVVIGNFDEDNKPDLVTANPGLNASNTTISLLLNTGSGGFGSRVDIPVGKGPYALAAGDFNKDEKLDLAAALGGPGSGNNDVVAVLLGDGAGFFTSITNFTVGHGADAVATGDFNKDGKLDLAAANRNDGVVSILLGDGTGSFAAQTAVGVGLEPNSITIDDFNKDGKQDLAVGADNYGNIAILLGNGVGGFGSGRDVDLGPDIQTNSFASTVLKDITGDGKLDLVALASIVKTNPDNSVFFSGASVAVGKGTGKFAPSMPISTPSHGQYWSSVAVANLDSDNHPDLIFTDLLTPGSVSTLFGDGTGQFTAGADFPVSYIAHRSIATGDFNGDQIVDLVVANDDSSVSLLLGNSSGGFGAATNFVVGSYPTSLVVTDFNKDNKTDLAVLNEGSSTFSILLGNDAGGFGPAASFPVSSGSVRAVPAGLTAADFNGDGKIDLATANFNSGDVSILLGKGNGRFNPPQRFPGTPAASAIAAADFNGDGKIDLAVTNQFRNDVSILLGNGMGGFGAPTDFLVGNQPLSVVVGDLNGDDKPDLAVANQYSKYVSILLNTCKPSPPAADLQLTQTDSPDPVLVNANLTYTLTVTNKGSAAATGVTLSDTLPGGVAFVSASMGCTGASTVTCALGSLATGATAKVNIVVKPTTAGGLSNTARVSSSTTDPTPGDNVATAVTTVQKPSLTVLSPNGGENWVTNSSQTIKWTSTGVSGNVKIELSRDGGGSWETLFNSTANDGNGQWTVTAPATNQARVRIRSLQNPTVVDASNGVFTLGGVSLSVLSPNGGETWTIGSTQVIKWKATGISGTVKVELSRDGGKTWTIMFSGVPNDGAQNWKVTGPATSQARMRVSAVGNANVVDTSNAPFTIK